MKKQTQKTQLTEQKKSLRSPIACVTTFARSRSKELLITTTN